MGVCGYGCGWKKNLILIKGPENDSVNKVLKSEEKHGLLI